MIRNSLICKLINVQASMKENNEKKINNEHEISKLIKAFPKDIAALDKRSVLAKRETVEKIMNVISKNAPQEIESGRGNHLESLLCYG